MAGTDDLLLRLGFPSEIIDTINRKYGDSAQDRFYKLLLFSDLRFRDKRVGYWSSGRTSHVAGPGSS